MPQLTVRKQMIIKTDDLKPSSEQRRTPPVFCSTTVPLGKALSSHEPNRAAETVFLHHVQRSHILLPLHKSIKKTPVKRVEQSKANVFVPCVTLNKLNPRIKHFHSISIISQHFFLFFLRLNWRLFKKHSDVHLFQRFVQHLLLFPKFSKPTSSLRTVFTSGFSWSGWRETL